MKQLKLKTIILACGLLLPYTISADISGIGFAQTNKEAKKESICFNKRGKEG